MLQVNVLRQNPEWVKERLAVKAFSKKMQASSKRLLHWMMIVKNYRLNLIIRNQKINSASKEIGKLMAQGKRRSRTDEAGCCG